jgi:hypothetical protein
MSERPLIFDDITQKFKSDVGVGTANPFVTETGTSTLTNKTLTSPTLTTPTITGGTLIPRVTDMAVDGAVTIQSGIVTMSKAGVLALTLAAPTAAQAGTRITFISLTDNAHTLTCPTNTLNDGTTGINELATFAAFAGACLTVQAHGVLWYVESFSACVITSTV